MSRMGPIPRTAAQRALKYIQKGKDCWLWIGSKDSKGYGRISRSKSEIDQGLPASARAHRVVYESINGAIPDGFDLDHLCRNRACVNPDHLEPVTRQVNLLRGQGITAENAAKTHCPRGHAYDEENTRIRQGKTGRLMRHCRACDREKKAEKRRALSTLEGTE